MEVAEVMGPQVAASEIVHTHDGGAGELRVQLEEARMAVEWQEEEDEEDEEQLRRLVNLLWNVSWNVNDLLDVVVCLLEKWRRRMRNYC